MWNILGPILGAGVGLGVYELFLKAESLSEVVQFTSNAKLVDQNSLDLTAAKIKHEVMTDGVNSWIMVQPSKRTEAVQIVRRLLK